MSSTRLSSLTSMMVLGVVFCACETTESGPPGDGMTGVASSTEGTSANTSSGSAGVTSTGTQGTTTQITTTQTTTTSAESTSTSPVPSSSTPIATSTTPEAPSGPSSTNTDTAPSTLPDAPSAGVSSAGESDPSATSEAATSEETMPGGTSWTPCASNPCKVLPLGDSITFGLNYDGGYRVELFRLAHSNGLGLTFVGSQSNGPAMVDGATFPKSHEGFSGWTIQQISDRLFSTAMPSAALAQEPEIVLLHIGTNDMYKGPDGAPERLGKLVDDLTAALPESLIVVSTIIPFPMSAAVVSTYNTALVQEVDERIDAGKHVLFVDQFEGFPPSELGDGVHPDQQGYARMGAKWYAAISEYLPAAQ